MRSCKQPSTNDLKMPGETEVVCQHKSSAVQSGFGLCQNCYMEFCGGLDGLEPPAFQRAEIQRLANKSAEVVPNESAEVVQCACKLIFFFFFLQNFVAVVDLKLFLSFIDLFFT